MIYKLFTIILEYFFGVRIVGEPVNYPEKQTPELRPLDAEFFSWSKEYKVGCQAKNKPAFW